MGRLKRQSVKNKLYFFGIGLVVLAILLTILLVSYNNNLKEISRRSLLSQQEFIALMPTNQEKGSDTEEASSDLNKSISEVIESEIIPEEKPINISSISYVEPEQEVVAPVKKELAFSYPVDGELVKDYAKDSLVFSETLQEWTVHNGIDIKADRTTVVKAAEDGEVIAIKNDPRYGLTIIIEHQDGYKTIYANLLTTEFVSEGETVEKGQSLGTVGNSGAFEIADEPHLHFEMMLNNEYVDPKIYLK